MNSTTYTEKRDGLVSLLDETSQKMSQLSGTYPIVKELPDLLIARTDLERVSRRVRESQYKFVLVAPFQGGKSTSANAAAGGLAISPMGNGSLSCSATTIVIQNVVDPADVGARIELRTPEELAAVIFDLFKEKVDLRDPQARATAWAKYQKMAKEQKANQDPFNDEKRDLLLLAGIILRFYDSAAVDKLRSLAEQKISLADVSALVRFPDDFITRSLEHGVDPFHDHEVRFAFIRRACCFVRSSNLQKIGAVITDCPGLGANSNDTKVALTAIEESDAVWYLLDARMLSQFDRKAIKMCQELCGNRIFFTANLKDNRVSKPQVVAGDIFRAMRASIRACGLPNFKDEDLHPYHALLSFLAMLGQRLLDGDKLDEAADAFLRKRCSENSIPAQTVAQAWEGLADDCLFRLDKDKWKLFSALPQRLSPAGVALVRSESEWDSIMGAMEDHVIKTRARTILIANGALKAANLLHSTVEGRLQSQETAASTEVETARAQWNDAEKRFATFSREAQSAISNFDDHGDEIDRALAEDYYRAVYLDRIAQIAANASGPLSQNLTLNDVLFNKAQDWWDEMMGDPRSVSRTEELVGAIVREAVNAESQPGGVAWFEQVKRGENLVFQEKLVRRFQHSQTQIAEKWEECRGTIPLLQHLPEPVIDVDPKDSLRALREIARLSGDAVEEGAIENLVAIGVVGIVSVVAAIIFSFPILALIAPVILSLIGDTAASPKEKLEQALANGLRNGLRQNQAEATAKLAAQLSVLSRAYAQALKDPLRKTEQVFEYDRDQAHRIFQINDEKRRQIAAECQHIRLHEIAPLRAKLQQFAAEVEPLC